MPLKKLAETWQSLSRGTVPAALLSSVFIGSALFWINNRFFGASCLRPKAVGEESSDLIYSIRYVRYLGDLLKSNVPRVGADVGTVFVYDSNQERRAIVTTTLDQKNQASSAWIRLDQDDVYLKQLDSHKEGACYVLVTKKLPNGLYKSQAVAEGREVSYSCPIQTDSDLFGYVVMGFKRSPEVLAPKVEETRSSAITRVLDRNRD